MSETSQGQTTGTKRMGGRFQDWREQTITKAFIQFGYENGRSVTSLAEENGLAWYTVRRLLDKRYR